MRAREDLRDNQPGIGKQFGLSATVCGYTACLPAVSTYQTPHNLLTRQQKPGFTPNETLKKEN